MYFSLILLLLLFSHCHVWLFVTPWTTARQALLCSPSSRVCSNSCPLCRWCYLTISFSAAFFYFFLWSFSASGSFPMSKFFTSGGQSVRASASASVLPKNVQSWFPLGWMGLIPLLAKGLSSLFQHHSSKASIQYSAFFLIQLSHSYLTTGKAIALTILIYIDKVINLLFNMLSRFVIAFLPRSSQLSFKFMAAVTICRDSRAQEGKLCHCFHFFPFYLP